MWQRLHGASGVSSSKKEVAALVDAETVTLVVTAVAMVRAIANAAANANHAVNHPLKITNYEHAQSYSREHEIGGYAQRESPVDTDVATF